MKHNITSFKTLGHALRDARKKKELSQLKTAKSIGLDQPTLSKIERGETSARLGTLLRLLAALDLEMILQPRQEPDQARGDLW